MASVYDLMIIVVIIYPLNTEEVTENMSHNKYAWDWFHLKFGKWGALLAKIGMIVHICHVVLFLVT